MSTHSRGKDESCFKTDKNLKNYFAIVLYFMMTQKDQKDV